MASWQIYLRGFWRRRTLFNLLLLPLSGLYGLTMVIRRQLYASGVRKVYRPPVPVIVAGGLTAGGGGKTTLVIALIEGLRERGFTPGLIARGYGSDRSTARLIVAGSTVEEVGDEPLLVYRTCQIPAAVGRDRPAAAKLLIKCHPQVDVIISDDGLQHLSLGRNIELIVCNSRYQFGNRWLLPAGPLRESISRIDVADAVIYKEGNPPQGGYTLRLTDPKIVDINHKPVSIEKLLGKQVSVVTGIAEPEDFFIAIRDLGIKAAQEIAFADHHRYTAADLAKIKGDIIIMTAKDAIKCRQLGDLRICEFICSPKLDSGLLDIIANRVHQS